MSLAIRTTGVEDYVDGSANIRMLVIGGAGAGKTRMSSFWPKPIYADCESGRASLADRNVPFTEIHNSQDMLDFLVFLKSHEATPKANRQFQTIVIDTLDGFQRRVFDERLQQTKKQTFSGFDDWAYLDSRMQMLMTRLLNLDYNVIVTCHYKDKTVKDGDNDVREYFLHLKGDIRDSVFHDFDLVGWLGTYWLAEDGERVEKRGLSFKRTPDRPFLKDRLGALPTWVPITLTSEQDYQFIRDALMTKLDGLSAGEVVGEIPSAAPEASVPGAGVVGAVGGPLPAQEPREMPLHQLDKTTLVKMCRDAGVTTSPDGTPLKGNAIKAELIQALEFHRASPPAPKETEVAPESDGETASPQSDAGSPSPIQSDDAPSAEQPADKADEPATTPVAVDTATGEITPETPVGPVVEASVVEVPSTPAVADNHPVTPPAAPRTKGTDVCEEAGCETDLTTQNSSYVQLSVIRFKKRLCGTHYVAARQASNA